MSCRKWITIKHEWAIVRKCEIESSTEKKGNELIILLCMIDYSKERKFGKEHVVINSISCIRNCATYLFFMQM